VARFLYVESCNQCPACKHGLGVASEAIDELFDPERATLDDFDRALYGARSAPQGNRCYLPVGGALVVPSLLSRYERDFHEQLVTMQAVHAGSDAPRASEAWLIPKIVDFDEATRTFTYDHDQPRKRPNWTYEEAASASARRQRLPKAPSPGRPTKAP